MKIKNYSVFFLLVISPLASAYSFDSDLQNPKNSIPGHEKLTGLAYDCVLSYKGKKPEDCISNLKYPKERGINSDTYFKTNAFDTSVQLPFTRSEIMKASGWPDDPVRELQFKSALKSAAKFISKCANKKESIRSGFFCNSHFGQLQYWHSMASYRSKKQEAESYIETRNKILSWAWFSFGVALGEIALEEKYCDFFAGLRGNPKRIGFAESFYPEQEITRSDSNFLYCPKDRPGATKMSIASVFNNLCTNAFDSKTCTVVYDSREIRLAAIGATIHAVQDSYSQSHANRNSCKESNAKTGAVKASSIINCQPISEFYDYASQSSKKHSQSDTLPVKVGDSCGVNQTHDAITATAMILWFALKGKKAGEVEEYISKYVLTMPDNISFKKPAVAGICYSK